MAHSQYLHYLYFDFKLLLLLGIHLNWEFVHWLVIAKYKDLVKQENVQAQQYCYA